MVETWLKAVAAGQEGGPPAQPWLDQWLGVTLPLSFRYDGRNFTGAGDAWQFRRGQLHREANVETQDWTWLHPKTGLKVTWHVKRFLDYPAVDTLLTFEDAGAKDTAIIEDVQNLDLKLNHSRPGKEYTIHGVHGGRCGADDFMPWKRTLAPRARSADQAPPGSRVPDRKRFEQRRGAVLQFRDAGGPRRPARAGMDRWLAGALRLLRHATGGPCRHDRHTLSPAPRRESPRPAGAAGLLERPAAARP